MLTKHFALSRSLLVVLSMGAGAAFAATDRGTAQAASFGRASTEVQSTRVIDTATTRVVDVRCGDTVTFVNGDRKFSWKFDAVHHGFVPVAKIAPADFGALDATVYVRGSEMERGG